MIYLNEECVKPTIFPDGTSQVWKLDEKHFGEDQARIVWEFSHESEFIHIAQLKNLLEAYGVERVSLHIDYLPYGRQDKSISNQSTFGLWTFGILLNTLQFDEIFITDPHSELALAAINKARAIYPHGPLRRTYQATGSDLVCYPDNGARTKYSGIYTGYRYIYGEKVRDQATGRISSYDLFLPEDPKGKKILIVDDICDGGKTFELLADQLYSNGVEEVNLFVTHGIFSKGLKPLHAAGIKRIFTDKGEAIRMRDGGFGYRKWETI